jgi:hypothetical protein
MNRVAENANVYAPYANPQKTAEDAIPRTMDTARLSNAVLKNETSL